MKTTAKKHARPARKSTLARGNCPAPVSADIIRKIGNQWAANWNAGDLEKLVETYAPDAVYLPPHHEAVHGRDAIHKYLEMPLHQGVSDLAFDVTYIKQSGNFAWDVGTYRMSVPQPDGTKKEDHGKYLTVWKRTANKWFITADSWSSDAPAAH